MASKAYKFITESPADEHRAGRMLAVLLSEPDVRRAQLTLTVEVENAASGKRVHQSIKLSPWVSDNGATMLTGSVAGSGYGEDKIKVGVVNTETGVVFEARDPRGKAPLLQYALYAALRYAWTGEAPTPSNGSVTVTEVERCARCGAELTDPESKRRGLGPECASKATGSKTILSGSRGGARV